MNAISLSISVGIALSFSFSFSVIFIFWWYIIHGFTGGILYIHILCVFVIVKGGGGMCKGMYVCMYTCVCVCMCVCMCVRGHVILACGRSACTSTCLRVRDVNVSACL